MYLLKSPLQKLEPMRPPVIKKLISTHAQLSSCSKLYPTTLEHLPILGRRPQRPIVLSGSTGRGNCLHVSFQVEGSLYVFSGRSFCGAKGARRSTAGYAKSKKK